MTIAAGEQRTLNPSPEIPGINIDGAHLAVDGLAGAAIDLENSQNQLAIEPASSNWPSIDNPNSTSNIVRAQYAADKNLRDAADIRRQTPLTWEQLRNAGGTRR